MSTSTQEQSPRITRGMTIQDIFTNFPHKAQRLAQAITGAGLHCVGCHAATWETLEAGMMGHGFPEEKIDELVAILNGILEEEQDLSSIVITPRAARKYLSILAEEGKQGWGLRLDEKAAGCNGFEFILDYSEKAAEEDAVFESQGIEVHVRKDMVDRMLGTEVDYVEGLQGAGFKVSNPNVKSSCGCGTSHNY